MISLNYIFYCLIAQYVIFFIISNTNDYKSQTYD